MKKALPPLASDSAKDSTAPTSAIRREFEEVRISSCSFDGFSHLSDGLRKLVVVRHGRSTAACTATVNAPRTSAVPHATPCATTRVDAASVGVPQCANWRIDSDKQKQRVRRMALVPQLSSDVQMCRNRVPGARPTGGRSRRSAGSTLTRALAQLIEIQYRAASSANWLRLKPGFVIDGCDARVPSRRRPAARQTPSAWGTARRGAGSAARP